MWSLLKFTVFLFALVQTAHAWPPEVAAEFNFSNGKMNQAWFKQKDRFETSNSVSFKMQEKFKKLVAKKCADCVITMGKDKYGERTFLVKLKTGWHFEITLDPGVIEIKTSPIPVDRLGSIKGDMDKLIWGVAEDLGLSGTGAGHLNFGLASTFQGDSLLFHNFIVDYFNNPGLSQGVLGFEDFANAPHPEQLTSLQAMRLKKLLDEFDPEKSSVQQLAEDMLKKVYNKTTFFAGDPKKFHAVNISTAVLPEDSWPRAELRAIPMQKDGRHFELLTNLFVARIEYLKKNPQKIIYRPENFHEQTVFDNVKDLYLYVTKSGLDWNDYRHLVSKTPPYKLALEGLDFYIEKGGMAEPIRKRTCQEKFRNVGRP